MKNGIVRSPLFYVGDKYKLIHEIKMHFPTDIGRLIEPFVGGGSVFMNVNAQTCLANDINGYVINIHRMLCEQADNIEFFFERVYQTIDHYGLSLSYREDIIPAELKAANPKTYFAKFNKEAYMHLRNDFNATDKTDMLILYILLIYGFNRMLRFNRQGNFNLPVGNVDFNQNTHDALEDYFRIVQHRQIEWSALDFRQFLDGITYQEDDLVYLDPPYLITFSEYNKLWNEQTERDLLDLLDGLNRRGIRFAISNVTHYKGRINDIFLRWATHYNSYSIKSNYISFHDNTIKSFNEVLITNY